MTLFCIREGVSGYAFNNRLLEQYNKIYKAIKLCDFKMALIEWQLNYVSCYVGLKSNLGLIEFANLAYDFRTN